MVVKNVEEDQTVLERGKLFTVNSLLSVWGKLHLPITDMGPSNRMDILFTLTFPETMAHQQNVAAVIIIILAQLFGKTPPIFTKQANMSNITCMLGSFHALRN